MTTPATMRAVVRAGQGAWVVAERARPVPGEEEVLVRVRAAGLNHADHLMREGRYLPDGDGWRVPPDRVGFEMAGEVVGTGARVMAQVGGALAEVVAVDAAQLMPVPDHLDWRGAAAVPSGFLTTYDAFTRVAPLRAGERVLVTGATSSTGLVGLQVARALGASRVVGTARSGLHTDLLLGLGADEVVVGDPPLLGTRGAGDEFDVVLDLVGGGGLAATLHRVAAGGRVAQVGRLGGDHVGLDLDLLARRRISLVGTTFRGRGLEDLRRLVAGAVASGVLEHLAPVVAGSLPFGDAESAAALLVAGPRPGKVVVDL